MLPAAITPISMGYKRSIVAKYKVSPKKVHVIEVGVDQVAPLNTIGNSKDEFVVMYSGVLGLGYDFNVILNGARFFEQISTAEIDDVVFIIRGVGEMASKLKNDINELDLTNVILDTRFLSKDELVALLGTADAFMLPMASTGFVEEGLPTKIFEYQAYGKPIICVSNGEPAKYVAATESGLVVKPNNAYGFAEAVVRLYKDRELGSKLGFNGRRYVSKNLTAEKIGRRIYAVFSSIQ
jgi:glycosyltransferase involved in cell wall biosynthesis